MSGYFRAYSNRVREASRELDERELRVYLALLSFTDCRGLSWPGYKLLCDITGVCNDAVRTALETLATKKYIEVVRKGARDPLTGQQWSNVYKIDGSVIDDPNCIDDESELPSLVLSSNEDSYHHQGTDSITQPDSAQPEKPPSSPPDSFEVEEEKPKAKRKAKTKTPEQSSIPKPPNPVPPPPSPRFFNGSLSEWAAPLAAEQEAAAQRIYVELQHKLPIRNARYLIATYGIERVNWALAHLNRQMDVRNPPGYMRHLLEKHWVEQRDGESTDPGRDLASSWNA